MKYKDRTVICNIISKMLDNPDEYGIYPTSTAYTELELYVQQERTIAVGWTYALLCTMLDRGDDPRIEEVPKIIDRAKGELEGEDAGQD